MLLGFKPRFIPMVLDGSKTHTIRGERKDGKVPRVGETCHCYTGLRQKGARLLGRWECVRVERITIDAPHEYHWSEVEVTIEGARIDVDECNVLAWRDGFRGRDRSMAFSEMMEFWSGRLPFAGYMIHWAWTPPTAKSAKLMRPRSSPARSPEKTPKVHRVTRKRKAGAHAA